MEEQIVFLDRLDDVASIKTKLECVRGNFVALVVAEGNRALHSPIAVRLVVRQADKLAKRLAIISNDGSVRRLFRDEGIPVFRTVKAYREFTTRRSAPLSRLSSALWSARTRVSRTVGIALLLVLCSVLVATAYVLVPSASIEITPVAEPLSDALIIKADPAVKSLNVEEKRIPARTINIPLESTAQVTTTGKKQTPSARAEGQVTFTNRTGTPVRVPQGTIVKTTNNVRFIVTQEIFVPAGSVSTARAEIAAIDPGEQGNVERGQISKIEGPLDQQLTVFNEEATSGGGAREVQVVAAADKERARSVLIEKMQREAMTRLEAQRRDSESLPPHAVNFTVLEESYDKKEGDQARALNVKIVGRASGVLFDGRDVNELVKRAWQPAVRPGYALVPDSFKVQPPEIVRVEGDTVTFVVRVEGFAIPQINLSRLQEAVRWKTAPEVKTYLMQSLSLAKEPKVTIEPAWASRALRVRVVITGEWGKVGGS